MSQSKPDRLDSLYDTEREAFVLSDRIVFWWTTFWIVVGVLIGKVA